MLLRLKRNPLILFPSEDKDISSLSTKTSCMDIGLSGIFLFGPTDPLKVGPVFDHQRVIKKSRMTEINPSLIIEMLKEENFD